VVDEIFGLVKENSLEKLDELFANTVSNSASWLNLISGAELVL
jgi:hypothetical protein